nr:reverse transcriptase domain, zinc finger, CCHC-type, aspartic peptidase domain protein [Tanacetum cinerariifolium]
MDTPFELKGKFLKELRDNTFSGSKHEDTNEHIEKVFEIVDLFHIPKVTQDQIMLRAFPVSLTGAKWHNGMSLRTRSTETFDGLAAIQAQLNNLGREVKKVNEKVYAAQFGTPYQLGGQYRAPRTGFYQYKNGNSSYHARRDTMEESLSKFMAESAKRHEENSNIIKEIRSSTDTEIENQGASIKILELQIGQMSKVLQERGFGSLPSSTETNQETKLIVLMKLQKALDEEAILEEQMLALMHRFADRFTDRRIEINNLMVLHDHPLIDYETPTFIIMTGKPENTMRRSYEKQEADGTSPPLLLRQFSIKWWKQVNEGQADKKAVYVYYNSLIKRSPSISTPRTSIIDVDAIERIQAAGSSKEEIQKILNEVRRSPASSEDIFQDSQDPYDNEAEFLDF